MNIITKPAGQRQAKPRRKQFDPAHHDRRNLEAARKILSDPDSPAGLKIWARKFLDRLNREGGRI